MSTFHLIIKGKVQGVFFRVTACEEAKKSGLTGWVKNTRNGDVEIMVNGETSKMKDFISWCNHGPAGAEVEDVIINPAEEKVFDEFKIIRG